MARLAQRLQVRDLVGTTVLQGNNMVNLGSWSDPADLLTVSTHRVGGNKPVANFAPHMVVTGVDFRVTPGSVVLDFCLFEMSMCFAVAGIG